MYVTSLGPERKKAIVKLAHTLNLSIKDVRKIEDDASLCLTRNTAQEIFYLRRGLEAMGLKIRIEPDFPYQVFDQNMQEVRPLSDEEIQLFQAPQYGP